MGLFDTTVPSTNPSDAEAFKLGASRIRSLQDTLQTMLGQVFATTTTYIPGWLTAAAIATGLITQDKLADGILTADAAGRLKMADGFLTFAKLDSAMRHTTAANSVNVSALTLICNEAHLLAALPKFVRFVLRCTDAGGDNGYVQNDEIDVGSIYNAGNSNSSTFAFGVTATNIWCVQRVGSTNLGFARRDTGANCTLAPTKWMAVGYAQV